MGSEVFLTVELFELSEHFVTVQIFYRSVHILADEA